MGIIYYVLINENASFESIKMLKKTQNILILSIINLILAYMGLST